MATKEEKAAFKAEKEKVKADKLAAKEAEKAEKLAVKAKVKADKEAAKVAKSAPVEAVVEAPVAGVPVSSQKIEFEGAIVLEILKGKETPTHFHCKMSNGTSMHVPKVLWE